MSRLAVPRDGEPVRVRGLDVEYSFWPARKTTRWKFQRRLYVKDPWAILVEAVYRQRSVSKRRILESLSFLRQAEEYFDAGVQSRSIDVKPVLLYYAIMNLAKCLISVCDSALDMAQARHGLVTKPKERAILGDQISVKNSSRFVNIFDHLLRVLEGGGAAFTTLEVRHLLPQILPGHRLWSYASDKKERFLAVTDISCYSNHDGKEMWLRLNFKSGELHYVAPSTSALIRAAHLPGAWSHVSAEGLEETTLMLEQSDVVHYQQRPIDHLQTLFQTLRPALWCGVSPAPPHRRYYVLADSRLGAKRLPQWASMYVLFFYLSDLTRYRPQHFDRFLESKYGPQIETVLDECPRQFLYLMASELLQREDAPASLA